MSLLVDHEIREEIKKGRLIIDPYDPELVGPNSLDFRLGDELASIILTEGFEALDPQNPQSFSIKKWKFEEYVLKPGEFVLGFMYESLTLPTDIKAQVYGRSSLGRLGLINSSHAGLIDCGFGHSITLELFNSGTIGIILRPYQKVGQLEFILVSPPDEDYSMRKSSRYYGQAKLQESKGI